jgi:ABC-2 type transport system permease protein
MTHTYSIGQIKPEQHSKMYWILKDASTLIMRSLKHIFKNPDQLIGLIVQPIMFMLLFRYVFGGAIQTGVSYVNFLMAGILVQMLAFGSLTTSISVAIDLQRGIVDRLKSLPIFSLGVVVGHIVADLVRNLLQSLIMIGVGLLVGFRPEASFTDWLLIAGIAMLFTFAMSWVAAVMAMLAKTFESVQWIGFLVIFPLTFASAAFAPTETMARGLKEFAINQPVTHVIEAIRALMIGGDMGNHGLIAAIWCVGIILVCIPYTTYLFRKHAGR